MAGNNLYDSHPVMIDSGTFWRCDHGLTGLEGRECIACLKDKIEQLKIEIVFREQRIESLEFSLSLAEASDM